MFFAYKKEMVKIGIKRILPFDEVVGIIFNGKKYKRIYESPSVFAYNELKLVRAGFNFDTIMAVLSENKCESLQLIKKDMYKKTYLIDCYEIAFPLVLGKDDENVLCVGRVTKNECQTVFFVQDDFFCISKKEKNYGFCKFTKTNDDLEIFDWLLFKRLEMAVKDALLLYSCIPNCK